MRQQYALLKFPITTHSAPFKEGHVPFPSYGNQENAIDLLSHSSSPRSPKRAFTIGIDTYRENHKTRVILTQKISIIRK